MGGGLCACVSVCLQSLEGNIRFPAAGVTGICESLSKRPENLTRVFCKYTLKDWDISLAPTPVQRLLMSLRPADEIAEVSCPSLPVHTGGSPLQSTLSA